MSAICERCHRGLKDPESIKRGLGPICAGKAPRSTDQTLFDAQYRVVKVLADAVWIIDLKTGRSVTNDAERVVAELHKEYGNRRIYYRDTQDCWDELKHELGRFTGFAPARDQGVPVGN